MNQRTEEELVRVVDLLGEEWLHQPRLSITVALIKATYSNAKGNLSTEHLPAPDLDHHDGPGRPHLRRHRHSAGRQHRRRPAASTRDWSRFPVTWWTPLSPRPPTSR